MHRYFKMIRPFDYIIVIALLAASFIPYAFFAHAQARTNATSPRTVYTAVVTHDGQTVYHIRLTGHRGTTKFRYHDGHDWNEIVTTDDHIQIASADCPDQVCVRKGQIAKPGQTIVCLPHKLLIEIKSSGRSAGNNTGGMVTE
ncbi:NusG domain II-containing protein [Lacticaseibacillus baoqingensis]|uniref:NusG domain II-containing protein n=1 Tax=Lacticaseibacillus baoqingensis TaxID=2486013 RepID=A0ABW4EBT4_9LACO|nr:NusG domain II-containing protein [Lacticaseibacillus baoqingensis]